MDTRRTVFAAALGAALIAFGSAPARADVAELKIQSQPGDFIGQGQTKDITYTPTNSNNFFIQIVGSISGQPDFLRFILGTVTGSNATNTYTTLDFSTAQLGIPIQAGTYGLPGNTAERASFADPGHPGLDVTFQNRGSNTLTGNFTVNSVSFFRDSTNTLQIGSFDVNFEQHSEGATPALFGHFTFQSSSVPEPSTVALLGGGFAAVGLAGFARRRRAGRGASAAPAA